MSILEFISDEPRDARPYVDYAIADLKGKREMWETPGPAHTENVLAYIDAAIFHLEDIAMKMDRERAEQNRELPPELPSITRRAAQIKKDHEEGRGLVVNVPPRFIVK